MLGGDRLEKPKILFRVEGTFHGYHVLCHLGGQSLPEIIKWLPWLYDTRQRLAN